MRKLFILGLGLLLLGSPFYASALSTFLTVQGGTGTSTPSGILYGDNGSTSHLNTVTIGSNLTFSDGTLSSTGGGTGFGTTSADYWITATSTLPSITTLVNLATVKNTLSGLLGANSGVLYQISTSTNFVTSLLAGNGISISGATGAVTVTNAYGYPFTPQTWGVSTTSALGFNGFLSTASSTIVGSATTTGTFFAGIASSSSLFGALLTTCQSGNFLTWNAGVFGCAAPTAAANPFTWTDNYAMISAATTSAIWAQNGLMSSSTANLVDTNINGKLGFISTSSDILGTINGNTFIQGTTSAVGTLTLGYQAGNALLATSSSNINGNTAFGYQALQVSTSSRFSTAFGYQALQAQIDYSAQRNSAFGYQALKALTTATQSTALGGSALQALTTGGSNTAVGYNTLSSDIVGFQNVAVGTNAGSSVTGSNNVLLGANVAGVTTGSNNIVIGQAMSAPLPTISNQLDIQNIIFGKNNSVTGISYSTGQVGIGSSTPGARFGIHANNADTNTQLFQVGSSTQTGTTTLFNIDNTGTTTLLTATTTNLYGANLSSCNGASNALTWSNGLFGCNSISAAAASTDFTFSSNFGVINAATSSALWARSGINASTTSNFDQVNIIDATTTSFSVANLASTSKLIVGGTAKFTGCVTANTPCIIGPSSSSGIYFVPSFGTAISANSSEQILVNASGLTVDTLNGNELVRSDSNGLLRNATAGIDYVSPAALAAAFPFTLLSSYGTTTAATTTPLWAKQGIFASSTSHFVYADFTSATTSNLFATGSSTIGDGTAIGGLSISGNSTTTNIAKFGDGSASNPSMAFVSQPNTGFDKVGTSIIGIVTNGTVNFQFDTGKMYAANGNGPRIDNLTADSSTAPVFEPDRSQTGTGFGAGTAANLNAIVSAKEITRWTSTGFGIGTTTPYATLSVSNLYGTTPTALFTVASSTTSGGATGNVFFSIDINGHIVMPQSSAQKPVLGTCGTNPSITATSTDVRGTITTGSGSPTSCTMSFAHAYTDTPTCVVSDASTAITIDISAASTTGITFSTSAALNTTNIYYICIQ